MKGAVFSRFRGPITVENLPDPAPDPDGVVVRVDATGLCRSDWHGWMGHDPDIALPHVPGHELAGTIVAVGTAVRRWRVGERVTVPFVAGCGRCGACVSGDEQVCANQFQPGFTGPGSFAEFVALRYADGNLVRVPDEMDGTTAASLGCRFATAYRAIVEQGRAANGEWVAVHGCGGVGLAAIMIAKACGAGVVAIDPQPAARTLATDIGADHTLDPYHVESPTDVLRSLTGGGPHVSIDAIGLQSAVATSLASLRVRGRHVQVGLLPANDISVPMGTVMGRELEILGSHGMQAHRYPEMIGMILDGLLEPGRIVTHRIALSEVPTALPAMAASRWPGITIIDRLDE
jgi:D-arabinose 1-dehydrogenase-like Zn-dependent alcohol dehydrogenase